ncbi:MAG TPA: hypothetical protein VHS56_02575 [Candidatus Cybelea sp.]|jgi:hypothetical protein|nr:hypothetical protein [Candidatus Cybelea sp.]
MTTERLEVSILAAPLAAIDRRALSQAWYSALHLDRKPAQPAVQAAHRSQTDATIVFPLRQCAEPRSLERCAELRATQSAALRPMQTQLVPHAVRSAAFRAIFPLSRRIERTFLRPNAPVRRATFSLGRGGARVHVILQSRAGTVTLVALCRPEMRQFVARALAQARLTLAARGFQSAPLRNGGSLCS